MNLCLFLDVDGTVTAGGMTAAVLKGLGWADDGPSGVCAARAWLKQRMEGLGVVPRGAIDEAVKGLDIDPGMPALAAFCRNRRIPLHLLTEGIDTVVLPALERAGVGDALAAANHGVLVPSGQDGVRMTVEFPAENPDCDRCACCLRNVMLGRAGENDVVVFAGANEKDICPAECSDLVFAREGLQRRCQERNVSYIPFRTLDDVRMSLDRLLASRSPRKRARAELRRRAAFTME